MWKPSELNTDITLYVAIADAIEKSIHNKDLLPGEKMPTQRHIAEVIGVNLTTVTRAYNLAKKRGLLKAVTGKGTFVADPEDQFLPHVRQDSNGIIDFGLVGSIKGNTRLVESILKDLPSTVNLDELLSYIPSQGMMRHRISGAKWVGYHGYEVTGEDVLICSGSMHAINCTLSSLFSYQATIAVDQLTFTGFRNACGLNDINLMPVAYDEFGMIPEALDQACQKQKIDGIYLMPNLQNPTAIAMTTERKSAIATVIRKHNLLLIEDDIYNLMTGDSRPMANLLPDQTIYICGTSKTLYAGLRIAFVVVPKRLQDKFIQSITATVWMASPIGAELVSQLIERGLVESIMEEKRKIIKERLEITLNMLKDYQVSSSAFGPFLWLTLPDYIDASEFEHIALIHHVRVVSAKKFAVGPNTSNAIRLSIINVDNIEELKKGLYKLLQLLKNPEYNKDIIM